MPPSLVTFESAEVAVSTSSQKGYLADATVVHSVSMTVAPLRADSALLIALRTVLIRPAQPLVLVLFRKLILRP